MLERLEGDLDQLRLLADSQSAEAIAQAATIAHRIAGVSGTFGFAALSGAAKAFEQAAIQMDQGAGPVEQRWRDLIDARRTALDVER